MVRYQLEDAELTAYFGWLLGIGNFYHLILQSYGFDAYQTILLGLPAAAIQTFFPLSSSWVARRYKDSRIWVMVCLGILLAGCAADVVRLGRLGSSLITRSRPTIRAHPKGCEIVRLLYHRELCWICRSGICYAWGQCHGVYVSSVRGVTVVYLESSQRSSTRKRITVGGTIFVAYAVGNLIGNRMPFALT